MSNRRKIVIYIAASLDGYIARKDDSLDWLFKVEGKGDNGYLKFYESVDTVLMGRRTYDWIMKNEINDFPYKEKECFVFSNLPTKDTDYVQFVHQSPGSFVKRISKQPGKKIWLVGGGELIHSFLKAKLVDELVITVAPILIGTGIPLFKEANFEQELTLKGIKQYNQFAELHYEMKK